MNSTLKISQERLRDYVKAHLSECCAELLNWSETGVLQDGHIRVANAIASTYEAAFCMAIVESEVKRQAMQFVARSTEAWDRR